MSVWYVCPSKRPAAEAAAVLRKWKDAGYRIGLWLDDVAAFGNLAASGLWESIDGSAMVGPYPGYAAAQNALIGKAIASDPTARWFVAGSDDLWPDPKPPEQIAAECEAHFGGTFGVMQPTGDRTFGDAQGPYVDRVAGSPWIGREFARRMYGGTGPYWPEWFHMGVDEELQAVATKMGCFWQRQDLTHYHDHPQRPRPGQKYGRASDLPAFLAKAHSPDEWRKYKRLFAERQRAGWPGHEPIL